MPNNVWFWKDGKVTMALPQEKLGASPNGVVLSLDEKSLYLGDQEPKRQICATNLAFGGDGRDLYVSACDAVYKIRLEAPGIISGPNGTMTSVVR
jgi:sugar lactone lactonase YvrE